MAAAITIDVVVPPGILRPAPLEPYLRPAMETAVERVRAAADARITPSGQPRRKNAPGYGPLKGSLTTAVQPSKYGGSIGFVRTGVFYGRFLEFGTRPHPIPKLTGQPRGGRRPVLAIPVGGGVIFRPRAQHPGQRPRFWMRGAAEQETSAIVAQFDQAARRWADAAVSGGPARA
jgi:hypothetical protein